MPWTSVAAMNWMSFPCGIKTIRNLEAAFITLKMGKGENNEPEHNYELLHKEKD